MTTTIVAFSAENVCRLTELTPRQLQYWDRTGFFSPRYADENRRSAYSRVYDFRDVVGLRTIALLRYQCNVPLQQLRKVGAWLKEHYEAPWSSLRFYVGGGKVYFDDPRTGDRMAGHPAGQIAFPFEMQQVEREMSESAERLKERTEDQIGRITHDRHVLHNAPVLAGTRIPTVAVWNFHEDGYDTEAILRAYPRLTAQDVDAAIEYEQSLRDRRAG